MCSSFFIYLLLIWLILILTQLFHYVTKISSFFLYTSKYNSKISRTSTYVPFSNPFSYINSSDELNALKNRGAPENDKGETGPLLINEYFLDAILKALAGSVNDWYNCMDFGSDTISLSVMRSLPKDKPNQKKLFATVELCPCEYSTRMCWETSNLSHIFEWFWRHLTDQLLALLKLVFQIFLCLHTDALHQVLLMCSNLY